MISSTYELRTKLLVWGKCHHQMRGGPLSVIRFLDVQYINRAEASNLQCGIIWFATWSRIVGKHAQMRELLWQQKEISLKIPKIFECALLHLGYTDYRHPWKHKPCGWNYETWTKRRIALSFHTGMVWPGIKMMQTECRLVSVGVSARPAYVPSKTCKRFKHARAVWRHPRRHIKKKESEALSESDGLCSSEHGL